MSWFFYSVISCKRAVAVYGIAIAATAHAPASADAFYQGRVAYNLGQYAEAMRIWLPLAADSNAKAQASIGYLYLMGLGVPRDESAAATWFGLAAEEGEPTAQHFLGILTLEGRGVPKDLPRAYMLCDLAMSGGFSGPSCRDAAWGQMDEEEVERANRLLIEWRRTHPDGYTVRKRLY